MGGGPTVPTGCSATRFEDVQLHSLAPSSTSFCLGCLAHPHLLTRSSNNYRVKWISREFLVFFAIVALQSIERFSLRIPILQLPTFTCKMEPIIPNTVGQYHIAKEALLSLLRTLFPGIPDKEFEIKVLPLDYIPVSILEDWTLAHSLAEQKRSVEI